MKQRVAHEANGRVAQCYISGVVLSDELNYVRAGGTRGTAVEPLHLQQGVLDQACGVHCVLMAVMLLTGMARARATAIASSTRGNMTALWNLARRTYFRGVSARVLARQVRVLAPTLQVTTRSGSHESMCDAVVDAVRSDAAAIVMLGTKRGARLHWVLVVGVEYLELRTHVAAPVRRVVALLAVDPALPPPLSAAYNVRIELGRGVKCFSADGCDTGLELKRAVIVAR